MKKSEAAFGLLRIPLDMLATLAALLLSYRLREASIDLIPSVQLLDSAQTLPAMDLYLQTFVIPSIGVIVCLAAIFHLYAIRSTLSGWQEVWRVVLVVLLWLVTVMGWYFLVKKQLFYSRALLVHSCFFLFAFITSARATVLLLQRGLMRHGIGVRQVASVGDHPVAKVAKQTLEQDRRYAYLGHCSNLADLKTLQLKAVPDLVLQTDPNPKSKETVQLIDYCRSQHIGYAFFPPVLADVPHQLEVDRLGLVPVVRFRPTPLDGWGHVMKRTVDVILSIVLLVVLSPILLVVSLAILLTMGRPILYVSKRIGERGMGEIPVLKFRSMVQNADAQKKDLLAKNQRTDGPLFKLENDPRITPLGRFLRRFDLDELPQLFNVFVGHMSLVGPRPHLPEEVDKYSQYERRVFTVKPGITGLAQVSGRSDLAFKDEVRFDLQYVEEWSPLLDLWILWRTLLVVIKRDVVD